MYFPGEQRFVVIGCSGQWQSPEQCDQILTRLDIVGLAGFDDRVKIGAGVYAADRIGEEPSFATDDEWPDRIFTGMVVDGPAAIVEMAPHLA
jgi:hypothetical protein